MTWTHTKPTKAGWWWTRTTRGKRTSITIQRAGDASAQTRNEAIVSDDNLNLPHLVQVCEAATPGPWCYEQYGEKGDVGYIVGISYMPTDKDECVRVEGELIAEDSNGNDLGFIRDALIADVTAQNLPNDLGGGSAENARFIATFNPSTILALLRRLMEAEVRVKHFENRLSASLPASPSGLPHGW